MSANGMTLYRYSADSKNKSNCTWSGCTAIWPPLTVGGTPQAGPGVSGQLGIAKGPKGGRQVSYGGWPLYTYAADTKPGATNGQDVKDQKGVWSVVFADPAKNPQPPA